MANQRAANDCGTVDLSPLHERNSTLRIFVDLLGRTWHFRYDADTIARLGQNGIDLGQTPRLALADLASDPAKLAAVLWICVEPQAKSQNISPESFASGLGPRIVQATLAFADAINFAEKVGVPLVRV